MSIADEILDIVLPLCGQAVADVDIDELRDRLDSVIERYTATVTSDMHLDVAMQIEMKVEGRLARLENAVDRLQNISQVDLTRVDGNSVSSEYVGDDAANTVHSSNPDVLYTINNITFDFPDIEIKGMKNCGEMDRKF